MKSGDCCFLLKLRNSSWTMFCRSWYLSCAPRQRGEQAGMQWVVCMFVRWENKFHGKAQVFTYMTRDQGSLKEWSFLLSPKEIIRWQYFVLKYLSEGRRKHTFAMTNARVSVLFTLCAMTWWNRTRRFMRPNAGFRGQNCFDKTLLAMHQIAWLPSLVPVLFMEVSGGRFCPWIYFSVFAM